MKEVDESREFSLSFDEIADKALEFAKEQFEDIKSLDGVSEEDRPIVEEVAREASESKVLEAVKILLNEGTISEELVRDLAKAAHGTVAKFVEITLTSVIGAAAASIAGEVAGRATEIAIIATGDFIRETIDVIKSAVLSEATNSDLLLDQERC